ncbi:MAG TPA: hypothetical protein VG735_05945 [Caulobacterales bacterium]|nr:hypothetical protein [Caulobacterales bacterium]
MAGGAPKKALSSQLQARLGRSSKFGKQSGKRSGFAYDPRQRAVVKVHYFSHGGAGAGALRAHVRYVARDAAVRGRSLAQEQQHEAEDGRDDRDQRERPRERERGLSVFYDALGDGVDGAGRAAAWARDDRRHFRLILSAENGARMRELQAYTRDVMARAERALGMRLEWIAVDHWDTDNPHTHIILRGRTPDGRDLIIPREFVSHGFRSAARDAATERLGPRGRADARRALERDALVHGPSRLDGMIAGQLDEERRVRLARLQAPDRSPELENALKARAQELKRMGLAVEVERNIFQFEPGWRDALKAMELHLDIRKSLMRARTQDLQKKLDQTLKLSRSLRLGPDR